MDGGLDKVGQLPGRQLERSMQAASTPDAKALGFLGVCSKKGSQCDMNEVKKGQ